MCKGSGESPVERLLSSSSLLSSRTRYFKAQNQGNNSGEGKKGTGVRVKFGETGEIKKSNVKIRS